MVEILLESGGQDVAVAESGSRAGTPTEYASPKETEITSVEDLTPIQEFYSGQSVFITGGTGFVGKLLIEKLLRGCPNIAFIYLLVRPKKGKDVHQRTEELIDDAVRKSFILPLFDSQRTIYSYQKFDINILFSV